MSESLAGVIRGRKVEADGIISFEIRSADGRPLPAFSAGSHIDINVAPQVVRQYSMLNAPSERERYMFAVLLDPNSRGGSRGVHELLHDGQKVEISPPRNNFPLDESAAQTIFLAGGIGITPLLSMAHRLTSLGRPFEFHYCARSRNKAAFVETLLASEFADRVHLHFDDEAAEQALRFDRDVGGPAPGKHLYVCGPSGFMDYIVGQAKVGGWNDNIHLEYFKAIVDTTGKSFVVVAAKSGKEVEVPEGVTIFEALLNIGIEIPISCEQGICGTCLTDVIEGIPEHRDMYQTEEEKAANTQMTPCCSRSLSPRLVLNL